MGHLIPAGTGLPAYRNLRIDTLGAEMEKLSLEEASERIEGVSTPAPDFPSEGSSQFGEGSTEDKDVSSVTNESVNSEVSEEETG